MPRMTAERLQAAIDAAIKQALMGAEAEDDTPTVRTLIPRRGANGTPKPKVKLSEDAKALVAGGNLDGTVDPSDFVLEYIQANRTKGYAGLHSVYSGLNRDFKLMYPDLDPVQVQAQMVADGLIVSRLVKGGAYLIPKEDAIAYDKAKSKSDAGPSKALAKVLESFARQPVAEDTEG